jgi:hypothetical protein
MKAATTEALKSTYFRHARLFTKKVTSSLVRMASCNSAVTVARASSSSSSKKGGRAFLPFFLTLVTMDLI